MQATGSEVKQCLLAIIEKLDDLMLRDLSSVNLKSGWSFVTDAYEHISFIREQAANLSEAIVADTEDTSGKS